MHHCPFLNVVVDISIDWMNITVHFMRTYGNKKKMVHFKVTVMNIRKFHVILNMFLINAVFSIYFLFYIFLSKVWELRIGCIHNIFYFIIIWAYSIININGFAYNSEQEDTIATTYYFHSRTRRSDCEISFTTNTKNGNFSHSYSC